MRVLTMVSWFAETAPSRTRTPPSRTTSTRRRPLGSSPIQPKSVALPPRAAMLSATLAAPPAVKVSCETFTTGTGASGEMREASPQT